MGCEVYANGMTIACKAADGKTVAAMPDVCLSPPSPPAGPIPIPYPNTAMASDTTDGSKTVQINGQEVMLKDKSSFKQSSGDEAATKSFGMGVVSHQIQGKVNFVAWSMDVKFEGENVPRHLDLTLHNEQSVPANTPTWPYLDNMTQAESDKACGKEKKAVEDNCPNSDQEGKTHKDCPPYHATAAKNAGYRNDPCVKAKRCMLVPYDRAKSKGGCCPGQTPHHIVPKHHFADFPGYDENEAPCVCVEGHSWHRNDKSRFPKTKKTHPDMHDRQDANERLAIDIIEQLDAAGEDTGKYSTDHAMDFEDARASGIRAHQETFPDCNPPCSEDCLKAQINAYHRQKSVGVRDGSLMHTKPTGAAD